MSETTRENAGIARRFWAAASQGNPDPVLEFDPNVVWRTYGQGPHAREISGLDAVLHYLESFGASAEALRLELVDIFSSEAGAIIQYRVIANRGPKDLETQAFLRLAIEDGIVFQAEVVPFDQAKSAAFWRLQ
ncbi:MAG: nuclear transport factor 2 family protein [Deltaproteobacteria bacterium]|nr:nuclear transport factor 2 family protein [Deltaproteobacteria bacterium]MBW2447925.1 nuclear transport factor 2 family protein [Deltaproteobacteria bacterium]